MQRAQAAKRTHIWRPRCPSLVNTSSRSTRTKNHETMNRKNQRNEKQSKAASAGAAASAERAPPAEAIEKSDESEQRENEVGGRGDLPTGPKGDVNEDMGAEGLGNRPFQSAASELEDEADWTPAETEHKDGGEGKKAEKKVTAKDEKSATATS